VDNYSKNEDKNVYFGENKDKLWISHGFPVENCG
jgi:hypothetical protein